MKECQAIKKNGAPCGAKGSHIVAVRAKGAVAYPISKVPPHVDSTWENVSINVCGAHKNVLAKGKAINVKYQQTVQSNDAASAKQLALIASLILAITDLIPKISIGWANPTTSTDADDIIRRLFQAKDFVSQAKKKSALLTLEQKEKIIETINSGPTVQWLNAAAYKLAHIQAS